MLCKPAAGHLGYGLRACCYRKGLVVAQAQEHSQVTKSLDALYEFEREPVTEDRLQPGRHFAGLFAGEHVAGTEFTIGALFVMWGVSALDVFVGLALGNLMAVLTWTFICAPIAVRTRLTLYWYLRKIAGPGTTIIYNVWNAFLFCILAGCMITVSASAVRIPFGIPPNTNWYPEDLRFVLVVIGVGAVVVLLAILGFKRLAQFASVCSPWMFLMFVGGAVVVLPWGAREMLAGGKISSFGDFWQLVNEAVWTGTPAGGGEKVSFWEVAAFAWVCNLAMHGGLSDMAIFRYAKSHWYGLYSAFGMFLGHYLAWICAGIMGAITALMLQTTIGEIDPGAMAYNALGVAGILAVVIAGWTTSNPTLYRAGLAMQAITPGWPRWVVTLAVGALTTAVACFPFVFTKLLDFVGLYGLLLVPVGAIVFTEHWIFERIGLTPLWVEKKKLWVSWPALIAWGAGLAFALVLRYGLGVSLFYLFIPTSLVSMVLYTILAALMGAREKFETTPDEELVATASPKAPVESPSFAHAPKKDKVYLISKWVALAALAVCFIWPLWLYSQGAEGYEARLAFFKQGLIVPTLLYFISGTIWAIKRDTGKDAV